jgi:hypothetical protein
MVSLLHAQITTVQSGNWSDGSTWAFGAIPTQTEDVIIASEHVVTVDIQTASCKSVSFGDNNSKLAMGDGSILNVYGNFTLATTTHTAFSAWGVNAKVRFTGSEIQKLSGWSTSAFSTSFQYLLVDKSDGKLTTDSTNMRLGIGDTLEVLNGTFELGYQDDIESRTFSGSATSATFIIHPNGNFNMIGSTSHIRRASNTSIALSRTGTLHVYGIATIRTTSTNRVNFDNVIIYPGGRLSAASFSTSNPGIFNPDTVIVQAGGELRVVSTTSFWEPSATVILEQSGEYRITASTAENAFPQNFINTGTVRYASTSAQTVKDMDYHSIEFSFEGTKTWTLADSRFVADTFEINNSVPVLLTATSPFNITVNKVLRLTTGSIENNDPNANIKLANNAEISRATGVILSPPLFEDTWNVRYTSTTASVTTGAELPENSEVNNLYIFSTDQTVTLGGNIKVRGNLTLSAGTFDNDGELNNKTLTIGNGSTIRRAAGQLSQIPSFEGTANIEYISTLYEVTTDNEIPNNNAIINNFTLTGTKGVILGKDVYVNGELKLEGSSLFTDVYKVTLGSNATLIETVGGIVSGKIATSRILSQGVLDMLGGLGLEINALGGAPGVTYIERLNNPRPDVFGGRRHFVINPTNNIGLNAEMKLHYFDHEVSYLNEANLVLYKSTNNGIDWTKEGGAIDTLQNFITLSGINSFSTWALNDKDSAVVGIKSNIEVPSIFSLSQNYPNPFNPSTIINFTVPENSFITLQVYNSLGELVATLFNNMAEVGKIYSLNFDARGFSSGMYFARLSSNNNSIVKKMVLIK